LKNIYLLLLFTLLLASCTKLEEAIPSYLYIKEPIIETDYILQGTTQQKLISVWLTLDTLTLGVFELPALVPIIGGGDIPLLMRAGIPKNGALDDLLIYPMFTQYRDTLAFENLSVDTIQPVFEYRSSCEFILLNDFENSNNLEALEEEVVFQTLSDSEIVFEGNRSGWVEINENVPSFTLATIEGLDIPDFSAPTFVEFNYKCDGIMSFYVTGIQVNTGNAFLDDLIFIYPTQDWNKIYVDLSEYLVIQEELQNLRIGFRATLPDTLSQANFYFDNIKVVHLPL